MALSFCSSSSLSILESMYFLCAKYEALIVRNEKKKSTKRAWVYCGQKSPEKVVFGQFNKQLQNTNDKALRNNPISQYFD